MEGGEQIYLEDLQWFGVTPDMVARSSDRMEIYYDYMQQIVEMGHAYVCTCDTEKWKAGIQKGEACPCRELGVEEQKERFQKMLNHTYTQGDCVLRIKTDLTLDDPSQIDWPLARIVDKPQHYRVKDKHLWPVYNFASAIDDHLMGVTLILRGQEHYQNMLKQKWLYRHFNWTYPHAFHHGRMLIKGTELSKSKIILGIQSGKYTGFDDPRLYTVMAMRRKGFIPQALVDLIVDLGVKPSDTIVDLQLLSTFNKKYLGDVNTIPFIQDPIALETDFVPALHVNLDGREYDLKAGTQSFLVSKTDASKWKVGTTLRLRNAYIVKINHADEYRVNAQFVSTAKLENTTQTNWLPGGVDVRITLPDNTHTYGVADEAVSMMNEGDEVFLPGFGYCRVDEKTESEIRLWFTHP
jgi:glutamyl-tRNA synthetase